MKKCKCTLDEYVTATGDCIQLEMKGEKCRVCGGVVE